MSEKAKEEKEVLKAPAEPASKPVSKLTPKCDEKDQPILPPRNDSERSA